MNRLTQSFENKGVYVVVIFLLIVGGLCELSVGIEFPCKDVNKC